MTTHILPTMLVHLDHLVVSKLQGYSCNEKRVRSRAKTALPSQHPQSRMHERKVTKDRSSGFDMMHTLARGPETHSAGFHASFGALEFGAWVPSSQSRWLKETQYPIVFL